MNGSNGRSPWLCARSWIRSHSSYASRDSGSQASSAAASGGRLSRSVSTARADVARKRSASRSQKMAPKWLTGLPATLTVSGNRTAHSLS